MKSSVGVKVFACIPRSDEWVLKGISGYIYGLWMKKTFGVNQYRDWIKEVRIFYFHECLAQFTSMQYIPIPGACGV